MRKLYMFNMMTLDGFFEGPNHDLSWHHVDEEFQKFAIAQLNETGLLIFGKTTYELMASFWPSEEAKKEDPETARLMTEKPKLVVSHSLEKADWDNTTIVRDGVEEAIRKLKSEHSKNIAVFGSANLSKTLIKAGLFDEFRIMLNPVILGNGTSLFQNDERLNLKLEKSRTFKNGNILLGYQMEKE